MLTREIALARLRATGTLASDQRLAIDVPLEAARAPLPQAVNKLMISNVRVSSPRHLAPSISQAVLP